MSHYSEQFLKQNPLAVLGVLRDLQKGEVPLRISWSNNQFISKILDASQERLVIDLGSQEYENRAALKAENIAVMAETQGAKVEFVLSRLELSEYQGLPAFVTPLPTNLWFVQRREYFRISAPLHPAYFCKAKMPDKKEIRFRLFDLSLGGMGALMDEIYTGLDTLCKERLQDVTIASLEARLFEGRPLDGPCGGASGHGR